MNQIGPISTIYYSYRTHIDAFNRPGNRSGKDLDRLCGETKDRMIDLLSANGIATHEIIRPEIYKHDISFSFLPHFKPGNIHLIFKSFENIRILKNAYNICVISWHFDAINVESQNGIPLTNHYRMLSLLDEIWVLPTQQKEILNRYSFSNIHLISEGTSDEEISVSRIIDRIVYIERMKSE